MGDIMPMLQSLRDLSYNRKCADCNDEYKNLRRANPKFGVFLCNYCAEKHKQIIPPENNKVLSVDRSMDKWSDEDLKMMALWGNNRANAYWGANIPWIVSPAMSRKDRDRLIHRKYVLRDWVPKLDTWELEMQKLYPLNKDELAVLGYINYRNPVKPPKSAAMANPDGKNKPEARVRLWTVKPQKSKKPTNRYHGSQSRDTRWSGEIFCDGRSVVVAKGTRGSNRTPQILEKIINDGRGRRTDLSVTRTCPQPPESVRRPFKPSEASNANSKMRPIIPPNLPPSVSVHRPLCPISPGVPPMITLEKSGDIVVKVPEDLLIDIVANELPSEVEVKTPSARNPVENLELTNRELWEIMEGL